MQEAGIPIRSEYILAVDYSDTNMYGYVKELFTQKDRPTAVFAVNYFTTMSTIMAMNELDISVPRDISVFGFDNYYLSNVLKPRLWLMEQPLAKIAEEGTRLLMQHINHPDTAEAFRTVAVAANMLEGDSIRKI